jgi:chromosome segregation ATPase
MATRRKKPTSKLAASKVALEAELKQLSKRLDALLVKARSAEASVRAGTTTQLRRLQSKQAEAKTRLAKLGRQTAAASGPIKSGLKKAWRDIDTAVRKATQRFREAA